MPTAGAPLQKTACMAASRDGSSCTLAWSSRPHDRAAAAAPAALGYMLAPPAAGLFRFWPCGRKRLGKAGARRTLSLTALPSCVRTRA